MRSESAAEAARQPISVLAALTVPSREGTGTFTALMDGVAAAAGAVHGVVLGGDLSRGESIAIAITVAGVAERKLGRWGARPGDGVWVTGELGGAGAALAAWTAGRLPDPAARARFARPEPRIAAGAWLASHGATAMMDLSDGLGGDAGHLAAASAVQLRIGLERLPVHPAVPAEAHAGGEPPQVFAARVGEDYELLVTLPAGFAGGAGFPLTRIGEVTDGRGVRFELDGRGHALAGYDHFA